MASLGWLCGVVRQKKVSFILFPGTLRVSRVSKLGKVTVWIRVSVKPHLHDTTGCQTGLTTGWYRVNKHPTGCQTGCQTGLTTDLTTGCIHDTTGCQLSNGFDNRLYRVNGALGFGLV